MRPTVVAAAVLLFTLLSAPFAWGNTNLVVRPGQAFRVHVTGFFPRTPVQLRLAGSAVAVTKQADVKGVLDTTYRAPIELGRYRLLISGLPSNHHATTAAHGTVIAVVPRLAIIPITVQRAGSGTGGTGGHQGHHNPGPPASTGIDLLPQVIAACALLLSGGALLAAGSWVSGRHYRRPKTAKLATPAIMQ